MTPAKSLNNLQFAGDRRFVGQQRRTAPTTTNEVRQSLQRSLCATKAANELAITDRTNIGGSNEPKLIKLFLAAPPYLRSAFAFADTRFGAVHQVFDIRPMFPKHDQRACDQKGHQVISAEISRGYGSA